MSNRRIPAVYMRGGAAKGMFFLGSDLPQHAAERDRLLLRVIGSPDPSGLHLDGMGAGSADTAKVAIITRSLRDDCDVDYLHGAVGIAEDSIDWRGNCTNLSAAVGPFAISQGLVAPVDGVTRVRIWQANLGRRIDAFVPVRGGEVLEAGGFSEDHVPFPAAEIRLEFLEPSDSAVTGRALLPTGALKDVLQVPGLGEVVATMVCVADPIVFVRASAIGLTGREPVSRLRRMRTLFEHLEAIRSAAALRMGLPGSAQQAGRAGTGLPKVAWIARSAAYRTDAGNEVGAEQIDLIARLASRGQLDNGLSGASSITLAAAAALPGSVVNEVARTLPGLPTRIGHQGGVLAVGAELSCREDGCWRIDKALVSRSARRLMSGWVHLPSAGVSPRA